MHCSLKCAIVMPNDCLNVFFPYFTSSAHLISTYTFSLSSVSVLCGVCFFSMIYYIHHGFYSSSRTEVYNHKLKYIKFMGMNEIPTTKWTQQQQQPPRMKLLIQIEVVLSIKHLVGFSVWSFYFRLSHFRFNDNTHTHTSNNHLAVGSTSRGTDSLLRL